MYPGSRGCTSTVNKPISVLDRTVPTQRYHRAVQRTNYDAYITDRFNKIQRQLKCTVLPPVYIYSWPSALQHCSASVAKAAAAARAAHDQCAQYGRPIMHSAAAPTRVTRLSPKAIGSPEIFRTVYKNKTCSCTVS